MQETIKSLINESVEAKKALLSDQYLKTIEKISNTIIEAYGNGKKTLIAGNGGSASDALHFAAELVVRFEKNRAALPSIALSENISTITAAGNDFGYEQSFSRQVEAFAQKGDVFVAISTSGNSPNVLKAIEAAKKIGVTVIGFTNSDGGKMKDICDIIFRAPSKTTARAQECHILAIHIICKILEAQLFKD
ncbi:D-sedoheptulose-7-phosphate isomerase [Endomicrobium proavitum]|uniref:Phosphoheptose isomerase n=1 Tax=Endomicrobium proavitum TaxID=1408281 RepID=A0A0G3WKY4_9BACT|nr:SIS domain-containing protein [Endomicrobium proavitum]AKL98540.1 Phosphoheptose isomerase [Endomicrobium proavitum]